MAAIEEFSVGYPVKFWTGGDTTRDAFGKQIQEIERIYGILNALGTGKASYEEIASAVGSHKYESNPHPNWKPSMSFSDLAGSFDGSKVIGKLPNANIDAGKVNGLEDYVKGLIPDTSGNDESGIADSSLNENGYVKFGNGLIMQWGNSANISESASDSYGIYHRVTFPHAFFSKCLNVILTPVNWGIRDLTLSVHLVKGSMTIDGFSYRHEWSVPNSQGITEGTIQANITMNYFAVGV